MITRPQHQFAFDNIFEIALVEFMHYYKKSVTDATPSVLSSPHAAHFS